MNRLPDRLNLDHLKKQAKDLIRLYPTRNRAWHVTTVLHHGRT